MSHEYTNELLRRMEDGHLITLDQFAKAEREADVIRRELESGELLSLLDEARARIVRLEQEVARDRSNRKHIWRQGYSAGKDDERSKGQRVTMNPYWREAEQ